MTFYSSSEQFYGCARALFERLLTGNPKVAEPVEKARLLMLFRCSEPTVTFLINGRRRPASAEFGSIKIRPEIHADLSVDTLHLILLGDLTVQKAISMNSLKVRGSIWKLTALADLFRECQSVYPEVLKQQGLV